MIRFRTLFAPALLAASLAFALPLAGPAQAQDKVQTQDKAQTQGKPQDEDKSWLPSLITETPEQGFNLAVSMARRAVKTTQPDVETLHKLRPVYSDDAGSLIDVSGVVAAYFNTVAQANDYWRK